MPNVDCPFPYSVNPHAHRAREHLTVWTHSAGLIRSAPARKRFERADFGRFAALVYPTAGPEELELMADWFAWLFLLDDQLDDGDFGRRPKRMAEVTGQMRDVLANPPPAPGPPLAPVIGALSDLWRRTTAHATYVWRNRFVSHLAQCLATATVWEARNRMCGSVPSEEAYIAHRRHTGAIYVCMDLIEIVEGVEVPPPIYDTPAFHTALDAACDVVCWVNDVYSLDKERSLGEVHNLVRVVQHHRRFDEPEAVKEVCAAIAAQLELYLAAEDELRHGFPGDMARLGPCLAGMRTWMRGNLDWSRQTQRYTSGHTDDGPDTYLEAVMMGVDQ